MSPRLLACLTLAVTVFNSLFTSALSVPLSPNPLLGAGDAAVWTRRGNDAAVATRKGSDSRDVTVPQWTRAELTLVADREYDLPLFTVDINVTFTLTAAPSTAIVRGAYWDGGATWRVRFAGPQQGVWQWVVTCGGSAVGDSLCAARGTVTVTAFTGTNPLFVHGFPRVRKDGRRFEFSDGAPLRWLGDTAWMAADLYHQHDCNAPASANCTSAAETILDDRATKGFTVFQTYFYGATNTWWVGSNWTALNATAFAARLDPLLDAAGERGMLVALGIGLHEMSVAMPPESLRALGAYTAARYGAHPLVWITAQEVNAPNSNASAWALPAERMATLGGYAAPLTAHMWPFTSAAVHDEPFIYDDEPWHSWYATQGGHTGMGIRSKAHYRAYYDHRSPITGLPVPFLEAEAMYENIICGPRFAFANDTRIAAWKATLCGSLGFTYGGAALWLFKWDVADQTGNAYNPNTWWWPNLALPGASQVALMSRTLAARGWDDALEPRFSNASWGVFEDDEETVLATVDGNRVYVLYTYGAGAAVGCLGSMDAHATYTATWFDPRSGDLTPAAPTFAPKADGTWCAPPKPKAGGAGSDWALFVERVGAAAVATVATASTPERYISAMGDPLLRSAYPNVLVTGWNFCNMAKAPAGYPTHPSPRWADCVRPDGTPAVSAADNALGPGDPFPLPGFNSTTDVNEYAVQKELFLAARCARPSELGGPNGNWSFHTIMLKSGNMNVAAGICPETVARPGVTFNNLEMNQPVLALTPATARAVPYGGRGYVGFFGATYDVNASATPSQLAELRAALAAYSALWVEYRFAELDGAPLPPRPDSVAPTILVNKSFEGAMWFPNASTGEFVFHHIQQSSAAAPWLMSYYKLMDVRGMGGGYDWSGAGQLFGPVPSYKSRLIMRASQLSTSNLYVPCHGGCWKLNGAPCDGDLNSDITRYLCFLANSNGGGCSAKNPHACPPFHVLSSDFSRVYPNDTARFPYSCYSGHCAPGGCDAYSNPGPQELMMIAPCEEWGLHGYPTSPGAGMGKSLTLDVGALGARVAFAGAEPADIGPAARAARGWAPLPPLDTLPLFPGWTRSWNGFDFGTEQFTPAANRYEFTGIDLQVLAA